MPVDAVRQTLLARAEDWNGDPRQAAIKPLQGLNDAKKRLTATVSSDPERGGRRWPASSTSDTSTSDWPALAQLLQKVDDQGHDVVALTRAVTTTPLNDLPAQDLRYRLTAHLDLGDDRQPPPQSTPRQPTPRHDSHLLPGDDADAASLTKRGMPSL